MRHNPFTFEGAKAIVNQSNQAIYGICVGCGRQINLQDVSKRLNGDNWHEQCADDAEEAIRIAKAEAPLDDDLV